MRERVFDWFCFNWRGLWCGVCAGCAMATASHGQALPTTPDAGALQQQLDRAQSGPRRADRAAPDWQGPSTQEPARDQARVSLRRFQFEGNRLLSSDVLSQLLNDLSAQALSFSQLQEAAHRVMLAYRNAGWLAYAYLPEQDVTQGEVRLVVQEATLGELVLQRDPQARISEAQIRGIFQAHQRVGEALRIVALDRALLLVSELPGLNVKGALSQAQVHHSARDVVLEVGSTPAYTGEASVDNAGGRATGAQRGVTTLNLNSLLGQGDLGTVTALKSPGMAYLRAELSWPVGYQGWRVSVYDAHLHYRIISPEFLTSNAQGSANTLGLSAQYPLWRAPMRQLNLNLQVERKGFDNQTGGHTQSKYHSTVWGLGLTGSMSDTWDAQTHGSVFWTQGLLNLNGSPHQAQDAAGVSNAGRFDKVRYALSRQQGLSSRLSVQLALSGQLANKNLDSSERFTLGGEGGVRAYPIGEGAGAQGQLLSLELRWRASAVGTLVGFYDWGQVLQLRDNVGGAARNDYALQGLGLAWVAQSQAGTRLKLSWARRMGSNPNPSSTGSDQDGSLLRNRFWVSLGLPFAL